MTVNPEELAKALADAYKTFADGLTDELQNGIDKVAKETKADVKANSPVHDKYPKTIERKTETYKKGWKVTITAKKGVYRATVHNKEYSLVHLLELGHLNRDGTSRSRKFPHVANSENSANQKLDQLIRNL